MALNYTEIVQPPKLAVRFGTLAAMIEDATVARRLIEEELEPVDPEARVPLYDVEEARAAWARFRMKHRG